MKEIIMMKKQRGMLLAGILLVSLGCVNTSVKAKSHDGFITGACAVGAALFAAAGVAAVVDWCCSETDDQLIARVDAQVRDIYNQYNETMTYFGQISGINFYVQSAAKRFDLITEMVLHEFATFVWYKNVTQYDYRAAIIAAKNSLQSCGQQLRKRISKLEGQYLQYEDQQRLRTMRQLLNNVEELSFRVALFADALEYHRTYFNLYDAIDKIRARYFAEISMYESGCYSLEMEIKRSILSRDSSQFAFRSFVIDIKSDIATLESKINNLAYHYPAKRQYAYDLFNTLVAIKNIIVNDARYQQELYEWEQARLQRLQLEALQAQARAERERADALREQNRILEERNRIERNKMYAQQYNTNKLDVEVRVVI